jgi:O-antigen/teichoic acid export membrane protein
VPAATSSTSPPSGAGQRRLADRVPAWLVGSGAIALAMGVMNLSTYGFTVLAARFLGPRAYSQLAAAMGVLLILGVVSLGLQATAARRIAADPTHPRRTQHEVMVPTWRASVLVGVLTLLAVPLLASVLRMELPVAVLIAVAAVPLTLMGGQAGVLQGERRWAPLALLYAGVGLGRLLLGVLALVVDPTAVSAMVAVAVGGFVPVVVGAVALRHTPADAGTDGAPPGAHARSVLGEVVHNSHALLAFFALSNCDILVARALLGDHRSGLYAGGLILAKAVLFLPQFVVVLVFPSMSADTGRRGVQAKALGLILVMGLAAVAVAAVAAPLAVIFIGGSEYAPLQGDIWAFALLGTVLAMTQLLVYAVVARQQAAAIAVVWGGLACVLALTPLVHSVRALVTVMISVLTGVLVGLALAGRGSTGRPSAASPPAPPGPGPAPAGG